MYFFSAPVRKAFRSSCSPAEASYTNWPNFQLHPLPEEWYDTNCFGNGRINSLENLDLNLKLWTKSTHLLCKSLLHKFHKIFVLEFHESEVDLPDSLQLKVNQWFGGKSDTAAMVRQQKMLHIVNKYTHQRTIHTPLRGKRPVPKNTGGVTPLQYVMKMAEESQPDCDFCNYHLLTAQDTFGRIESSASFTASNVLKMNRWHGLIISKKHNCVNLTLDDVTDLLMTATKWFDVAHSFEEKFRFPMLSWDNMAHAGASQFHPHLQVFLDSYDYYGIMETLRHGAQQFVNDFGTNYFADVATIHETLGLAVRLGQAVAYVDLTEKGSGEFVVIGSTLDEGFCLLIFCIIRTFMEELDAFSFTGGIAFPILTKSAGSLPVIARITTRGDVSNIYSEISGFDLYLSPNTSRDPYKLVAALRNVIRKYVPKPLQ